MATRNRVLCFASDPVDSLGASVAGPTVSRRRYVLSVAPRLWLRRVRKRVPTRERRGEFVAGETPVEAPDDEATDEPAQETPTVIVRRVAANGTVIETLEMYDDESIEIETPTNQSTSGAENATVGTIGGEASVGR